MNEKLAVLTKRANDIAARISVPSAFQNAFKDEPAGLLDPTNHNPQPSRLEKPVTGMTRNRFLGILAKQPKQWHPVFIAFDAAPEMSIDELEKAAKFIGDQVIEMPLANAQIAEGWEEEKTLRRRGERLVLMRRTAQTTGQELVATSQTPVAVNPTIQPSNYIEGIGVYPAQNPQILQTPSSLLKPIDNSASHLEGGNSNLQNGFMGPLSDSALADAKKAA